MDVRNEWARFDGALMKFESFLLGTTGTDESPLELAVAESDSIL
jgi:hypothetical protein